MQPPRIGKQGSRHGYSLVLDHSTAAVTATQVSSRGGEKNQQQHGQCKGFGVDWGQGLGSLLLTKALSHAHCSSVATLLQGCFDPPSKHRCDITGSDGRAGAQPLALHLPFTHAFLMERSGDLGLPRMVFWMVTLEAALQVLKSAHPGRRRDLRTVWA